MNPENKGCLTVIPKPVTVYKVNTSALPYELGKFINFTVIRFKSLANLKLNYNFLRQSKGINYLLLNPFFKDFFTGGGIY